MPAYASAIPRPPRTLTELEQARLLKVTGEHRSGYRDHCIFAVALGTGLREHEIAALDVLDVLHEDGRVKRRIALDTFKRLSTTSNGYLASVENPAGKRSYGYDSRGLVHTVTVDGEGQYVYEYDPLGRNRLLVYPDGHCRVQAWDERGRLVSRCYQYDDPQLTRCYTATYDAVGNPVALADPEATDVIGLDSLDRVVSVTRQVAGQPDAVETYGYNALGALAVNAGVAMDHRRPALSGGALTDAALSTSMGVSWACGACEYAD